MKTGIIIPCYNEEKRLQTQLFVDFIKEKSNYHLCFVNDGSSDNTIKVLKTIKAEAPSRVSIIDVKRNGGKAAAVRVGARFLYNKSEIEYIGFIDADLSTDFNDMERLVKILDKNTRLSMIFGSREKGDGNVERDSFRKLFSRIIKAMVYMILRLPITDTQCGAKVFRREVIPVIYDNQFISRWLFDVEIFLRLKKFYGASQVMSHIEEVQLMRWVHVDDSKLGLKDAMQIPYRLLSIWFAYTVKLPVVETFSATPAPATYLADTAQLTVEL